MGYWILFCMIVCVVALVILALVIFDDPPAQDPNNGRVADSPDPPTRSIPATSWIGPTKTATWLAIDATYPGQHWPERIASMQPELRLILRSGSDLTVEQLAREFAQVSSLESYNIASFVVGLDDILSGTPLDAFTHQLGQLLSDLHRLDVVAIIGNVPDLSRLNIPAASGLAKSDLRQVSEEWNIAIDEAARQNSAIGVDLFDLRRTSRNPEHDAFIERSWLLQDYTDEMAERFAPVISATLVRLTAHQLFVASESPLGTAPRA